MPVSFPNTSLSSITKLQTIQNSALRIATGCVIMTDIDHLHTEIKTLKVGEHFKMLCSQFLATCLQPNHVSFPIVTADSCPRRIKQSLLMGFNDQINDLLVNGSITDIKVARKMIHTRVMRETIGSRSANGVLLMAAPDVRMMQRQTSPE